MADVLDRTLTLAQRAEQAGVDRDRILIDPAHDFGKNAWHSLEISRRLAEMTATGWPVLLAVSNKDFVGETLGVPLEERLAGTLAVTSVAAWLGARVFRPPGHRDPPGAGHGGRDQGRPGPGPDHPGPDLITRAALCPAPPLLARDLTGRDLVLPELRDACARAVAELVRADPEVIVVVGPAAETAEWDPESRPDLSAYAPALGPQKAGPACRLSLGLGALLLDQAGYTGRRVLQAVAGHEPALACTALGARWAATGTGATAMLTMGDGSARRSTAAPGYLDERAVQFDTAVEAAVRAGDLAALASVDPALAGDLMATGRPAWQVLARRLGPGPAPGHRHPLRRRPVRGGLPGGGVHAS